MARPIIANLAGQAGYDDVLDYIEDLLNEHQTVAQVARECGVKVQCIQRYVYKGFEKEVRWRRPQKTKNSRES